MQSGRSNCGLRNLVGLLTALWSRAFYFSGSFIVIFHSPRTHIYFAGLDGSWSVKLRTDKSVIFLSAVFCCIYLSGSAIVIFPSPRIRTRFADWMQAGHSVCADWELSLTDLLRTLWSNAFTYLAVHKIPPSVSPSEPQPSRMGETKVMKSAKTKCKSSLRSLFWLPNGNVHCMARKRRHHETTHRGNGPISVLQAKAFASK